MQASNDNKIGVNPNYDTEFYKVRGNKICRVLPDGKVKDTFFQAPADLDLTMSRIIYTRNGVLFVIGGASNSEYTKVFNTIYQVDTKRRTQATLNPMRTV